MSPSWNQNRTPGPFLNINLENKQKVCRNCFQIKISWYQKKIYIAFPCSPSCVHIWTSWKSHNQLLKSSPNTCFALVAYLSPLSEITRCLSVTVMGKERTGLRGTVYLKTAGLLGLLHLSSPRYCFVFCHRRMTLHFSLIFMHAPHTQFWSKSPKGSIDETYF